MNNQVQQTSIQAFEEIQGKIPTTRERVFNVIGCYSDITNAEIAKFLGWAINRVTPRVLELRNKRFVVFSQTRECEVTHRYVNAWKIRMPDEDESIKDQELMEY